jgi:tripeptide aminopeptidase
MNKKYHHSVCTVTLKDTYYNMFEKMKDHLDLVDLMVQANEKVGIVPKIEPIRGGTDGARLTYEGLLCPNLATGGYNFHGKMECISIEAMDHCTDVLIQIVHEVFSKKM